MTEQTQTTFVRPLGVPREYTDTDRLDWLARFVSLSGDTRVTASDGLPAASWWEWDRTDGALRSAIDAAMLKEVARVA